MMPPEARRRLKRLKHLLDPDNEVRVSVFLRKCERFYARIRQSPEGCLRYTGAHDLSGYGQVRFCRRLWKAHVLYYILAGGIIPMRRMLAHSCAHRDCVNPQHMLLVRRDYPLRRYYSRTS